MQREIPGSVDNPDREFVFVELRGYESFRTLVDGVLSSRSPLPLPREGGILEESTVALIADELKFLAMSYKGDISGWRGRVADFCLQTSRQWGIAADGVLMMSDGRQVELQECKIIFLD